MTTRRTVDSKAGTLKTMSKMTEKSAVAKLFTYAALSLMAVSTMSFVQANDSAVDQMVVAKAELVTSDSNADMVIMNHTKFPKVVLSEEFVNTLRNIKLEVAKADKEVVKSLYTAEKAKREAVKFYQNSGENFYAAESEVAEAMKFEALKYAFNMGSVIAAEEASNEVDEHMNLASVKLAVNAAMLTDVADADQEVKAGVTEKSPETAVAKFMKSTSANIADADAEILNSLSTQNTKTAKK